MSPPKISDLGPFYCSVNIALNILYTSTNRSDNNRTHKQTETKPRGTEGAVLI